RGDLRDRPPGTRPPVKERLLRLLERAGVLRRAYGLYEMAKTLTPGPPQPSVAADGLPVPPRRLIVRVAGTASTEWFLEGGRLGAETIREVLARQGRPVEELGAMLDFGCGCGRVTDRKSTRLNSSHDQISYAVFCLKKKKN